MIRKNMIINYFEKFNFAFFRFFNEAKIFPIKINPVALIPLLKVKVYM